MDTKRTHAGPCCFLCRDNCHNFSCAPSLLGAPHSSCCRGGWRRSGRCGCRAQCAGSVCACTSPLLTPHKADCLPVYLVLPCLFLRMTHGAKQNWPPADLGRDLRSAASSGDVAIVQRLLLVSCGTQTHAVPGVVAVVSAQKAAGMLCQSNTIQKRPRTTWTICLWCDCQSPHVSTSTTPVGAPGAGWWRQHR